MASTHRHALASLRTSSRTSGQLHDTESLGAPCEEHLEHPAIVRETPGGIAALESSFGRIGASVVAGAIQPHPRFDGSGFPRSTSGAFRHRSGRDLHIIPGLCCWQTISTIEEPPAPPKFEWAACAGWSIRSAAADSTSGCPGTPHGGPAVPRGPRCPSPVA